MPGYACGRVYANRCWRYRTHSAAPGVAACSLMGADTDSRRGPEDGATSADVLAAAAAWVWTPYDATVAETDDIKLVLHHGVAIVHRAVGTDAVKLVIQVLRLAGSNKAEAVRWPVHPATQPADLGAIL